MIRVAINGFGRMGRLTLRAAWNSPELEFVQINENAADAQVLQQPRHRGKGAHCDMLA